MKARRVFWLVVGVVVLVPLGEAMRCYFRSLPSSAPRSAFESLQAATAAFGQPDQQVFGTSDELSGKTIAGEVLPKSYVGVHAKEALTVSTWRCECFVVARRELFIVSTKDGRAIHSGGTSRYLSPILVLQE